MIRSMTGFGRVIKEIDGKTFTVEMKSVNHRFFECAVRTPRGMAYLEEPVKAYLKSNVSRGKMEVYITLDSNEGEAAEVSVNTEYLEGYLKALKEISKTYKLKNDVKLSDVIQNRDIFVMRKAEDDQDKTTENVLSVLKETVDAFTASREKEGQALKNDILARLNEISANVKIIEARSPETVKEYTAKLLGRMRDILGDTTIDESRILTEAAIYADKITVAEETTRLNTHITNFTDLLEGDSPIGKKLDFYMQEMNREINTIGSKCNDISIAKTVVEVKNQLENIREQIQNIE